MLFYGASAQHQREPHSCSRAQQTRSKKLATSVHVHAAWSMVGGGAGYAQAQPGTAGTYPRGLRPSLSSTPWFFSGSGRAGARLRACASLNEKAYYRSGRPRHCLLQAGGAMLPGLQPAERRQACAAAGRQGKGKRRSQPLDRDSRKTDDDYRASEPDTRFPAM